MLLQENQKMLGFIDAAELAISSDGAATGDRIKGMNTIFAKADIQMGWNTVICAEHTLESQITVSIPNESE